MNEGERMCFYNKLILKNSSLKRVTRKACDEDKNDKKMEGEMIYKNENEMENEKK